MEIMLVMSKTDDIPDFVTDIKYFTEPQEIPPHVLPKAKYEAILSFPYTDNDYDCHHVIDMKKVTIRYGERTILKDLDWTVCNGERWALSGQNGSGKSTLLSLVCADNPQSYACDITLFDRPRGSGESIWDIKKHIGYVSPEMHRSYKRNLPAIRIVASGLMDSIGLYAIPNPKDYERCRWWLDIFGIGHLADTPFLQLSSGEQRLVLLARAFVKDPQLLILDEPLHGLDLWNRRLTKDIIEAFCQRKSKTMIMVTHYQEELPNVITNSLFLKKQI
jgi:molybdate transport system ATP-binding protein